MPRRPLTSHRAIAAIVIAGVVSVAAFYWFRVRTTGGPRPGSAAYEQTTRTFYTGLAALQVGLLEDAARNFAEATVAAPGEPSAWANLGVARLRLADLDAAEPPIRESLRLAPASAEVHLLAGRFEIARGRLDEGIGHLREAVTLAPRNVRARFTLAEELERSGAPEQAMEALTVLDELARSAPRNAAVLLERARLAATQRETARLKESVSQLAPLAAAWSPVARTQQEALAAAVAANDTTQAVRSTLLLRNALAREASFTRDLAEVRTPPELVADAFERFLVLDAPVSTPAAPDTTLRFTEQAADARRADVVTVFSLDGTKPPVVFAADATTVSAADGSQTLPFPGAAGSAPGAFSLLALDWNNDFATDLLAAGDAGVRLYVQHDGTFSDATDAASKAPVRCGCRGAWSADIEMDGDLDVVLGVREGATQVLRNNGDSTWTVLDTFAAMRDLQAFAWADLDRDGDPDAVFLAGDTVRVLFNNRAGAFAEAPAAPLTGITALTVADLKAGGRFDIVTAGRDGSLRQTALNDAGAWDVTVLKPAAQSSSSTNGVLLAADLDNNGALDLVLAGGQTQIWLADATHTLQPLRASLNAGVSHAIDLNGDGRLDLVGAGGGGGVRRWLGTGDQPYHWKDVRVRAQATAGDQRINPFAVGGEIDVRAGLLRQRQLLTGGVAHFGLGTRTAIDVVQIIWPNGAPQVEFASGADSVITAEQRLKGSCPWVFADDGHELRFVTDFIWRSPLGLRINAQDTAGPGQTEDWVRIRGDQLAERHGRYDVRITAELWETHFFDHVSLLVVDHPASAEVFVDERFVGPPITLAVQAVRDRQPVVHATDDAGTDVTTMVAARDGRHLDTFARGHYQGIARDHAVAFDLPAREGATQPQPGERLVLIGEGWVYPTDSSINVAAGQGGRERPRGLALEYQSPDGRWITADANLGFPAGKNKSMVIDLARVPSARRVRLRTNMEVYWDALSTAVVTPAQVRTERLPAASADLRYRGFSRTASWRASAPETPSYAPVAAVGQRWRDLAGYYTRFGDVRELLTGVDDRYVIMNAGDELAMTFAAPAPPPAGWTRDFVLIGDGWEKDGDYNTEFSATVLPLPSHAPAPAGAHADTAPPTLEQDPVYQRHRDDWERYHTRHVRPDDFADGLALSRR